MTAKAYLSQVKRLDARIGALLDRQRRYHEIGAWRARYWPSLNGLAAMRALERELDGQIVAYADLVREVESVIDAVGDAQYRDVLKFRYLNGWTWRKVAERMRFSKDWVCHLHERALRAVRVPE